MAWDVLVRSLFTDSGVSAGLAKLNSQIHDVAKAAPGGTRAFNAMETGLRSLAFEAVGVQGPIGRVAEGFLKFGGGSALVLGAVAGIGLIAGAYRLAAAEAKKLSDANVELNKSWADITARGKPTVALMNEYLAAVNKASDAQEELDRLSRTRATPHGPVTIGTAAEIAQAQANVDAAGRSVDAFRTALDNAHQTLREAADKDFKSLREELAGINSEIQRFLALNPAFLEGISVPSLKDILRGPDFTKGFDAFDEARLDASIFFAQGPGKIAGKADIEAARKRGSGVNAAAIAANSVALLGAASQGGAGGILSAGGGLLSAIPGLGTAGIVATALGGVFSLFDHSAERRTNRIVAELTRIRENTTKRDQPDHVSVTLLVNGKEITGAILGDIAYGLQRMRDTNGLPVLPPS